jgi:hypothetical protein
MPVYEAAAPSPPPPQHTHTLTADAYWCLLLAALSRYAATCKPSSTRTRLGVGCAGCPSRSAVLPRACTPPAPACKLPGPAAPGCCMPACCCSGARAHGSSARCSPSRVSCGSHGAALSRTLLTGVSQPGGPAPAAAAAAAPVAAAAGLPCWGAAAWPPAGCGLAPALALAGVVVVVTSVSSDDARLASSALPSRPCGSQKGVACAPRGAQAQQTQLVL